MFITKDTTQKHTNGKDAENMGKSEEVVWSCHGLSRYHLTQSHVFTSLAPNEILQFNIFTELNT
jgi:hypothetical protein